MYWLDTWPDEFHDLMCEVVSAMKLESLFLEQEISGLSGARTFRASSDSSGGFGNPFIVKISSTQGINDEIGRINEAGIHFNMTPAVWGNPITHGDMACIVMRVALDGQGKSLRDCFSHLQPDQVVKVIRQLFDEAVQITNRNIKQSAQNVFAAYQLQENGFVRELRAAGDTPFTLYDWWNRAAARSRAGRNSQTYIHGDLHGGNVLVNIDQVEYGNSVRLLDLGTAGMGHAFRDIAKLERDLWLFVDEAKSADPELRCKNIEDGLRNPAHITNDAIARAVRGIETLRAIANNINFKTPTIHEYTAALMAQFMFAAIVPTHEKKLRSAALKQAHALKLELENLEHGLKPGHEEIQFRVREDLAWRFAYSFLRLDQLPSGGWSRTLPMWMEAIWEGEHGTVFRSPDMKEKGGTDSTGYAISQLVTFWRKVFQGNGARQSNSNSLATRLSRLLNQNFVLVECANSIDRRVGDSGGIDVGVPGRGSPPPVKVRHSLVGLLSLLNIKTIDPGAYRANVADLIIAYLQENLQHWEEDKSHLFGMYASGVALWSQLEKTGHQLQLRNELDLKLREIVLALEESLFKPNPEGTYPTKFPVSRDGMVRSAFFPPYYGFWRMERSNALMFLPLLVTEDGGSFLRPNELSDSIIRRLRDALNELLTEINHTHNPETGLIAYNKSSQHGPSPIDWGLSTELLALLEIDAIAQLALDAGHDQNSLKEKKDALRNSLVDTLADYPKRQHIFSYSHGLSCGVFLASSVSARVCPDHVEALDKRITHAINEYCTEMELYRLAAVLYGCDPVWEGIPQFSTDLTKPAKGLTELFVGKLVAGEHCKDLWNENRHEATIAFFDSEYVKKFYMPRYLTDTTHDTLITRIEDVFGKFENGPKFALDLGCGAGQCGNWLFEHGFSVHLIDASKEMVAYAKKTMESVSMPPSSPNNYYIDTLDVRKIHTHFKGQTFHLIVANALLVHISPQQAGDLFVKIYQLLEPNGRFFVNFKLHDHTLISLDNRYFAYYRDYSVPKTMLRNAGFHIDEIALRRNNKNLYDIPMSIEWANFYCHRPG